MIDFSDAGVSRRKDIVDEADGIENELASPPGESEDWPDDVPY